MIIWSQLRQQCEESVDRGENVGGPFVRIGIFVVRGVLREADGTSLTRQMSKHARLLMRVTGEVTLPSPGHVLARSRSHF